MKKTLTIILALVLVLSIGIACVACNNNNNTSTPTPGRGDNPTPPPAEDRRPTQEDLDIKTIIDSYVSAWLVNNVDSGDLSNALNTALDQLVNTNYRTVVSSVKATKQGDSYTLTYKFKDKASATSTVAAPVVDEGIYAGLDYAGTQGSLDADHAFGALINGVFKTIKKAVDNGQAFADNGFGFDATAYFDFHYGDMEEKLQYALRLAGQIGVEAKDTFVAIEVMDGANVLGGLYYDGDAEKANCKLALHVGDYKYYIDNADINAIVVAVIEYIQSALNPQPTPNQTEHAPAMESPFYNTTVAKLSELLPEGTVSTVVGNILSSVITDISEKAVTGGTQIQIKIDIGALLASLRESLGSILGGIDLSTLPAPLNQLNLSTFQGVGGTILITGKVVDDGSLGGLELSYNCGKKDFRFNEKDTQPKIYGPINVALGIKNFEIGAQNVARVVPSLDSYTYFSPLNADITVDLTVNGEETSTNIVSDINPFALENGKITFVTTDAQDVVILKGIISTADGSVAVKTVDGLYRFTALEFAQGTMIYGMGLFGYIVESPDTVFAPVVSYIKDLVAMFAPAPEPNPEPAPEEVVPAEDAEGGFSINDIVKAVGIVDAAKELIATWKDGRILEYKLDGETLLDNYFEVTLDYEAYNQVLALVREYLTFIPEIEDFDASAAKVYVNFNHGDYEKMLYVSVKYAETTVLVAVDGSKLMSEGLFEVRVNVNEDLYKAVVDVSTENVVKLTYDAKGVRYVDITVNTEEGTLVANLMANDHNYTFGGSIKTTETSGTLILDLNGISVVLKGGNAVYEENGKTSFDLPTFTASVDFGWALPSGVNADVTVSVTLNSWGETVQVADLDDLLTQEGTLDINAKLGSVFDAIMQAITVPASDAE